MNIFVSIVVAILGALFAALAIIMTAAVITTFIYDTKDWRDDHGKRSDGFNSGSRHR